MRAMSDAHPFTVQTNAAQPLRYMRWWKAGGYSLVLAVIALSLVPNGPQIDIEQGDKLGHFMAYGSLMFWFSQLEVSRRRVICAVAFIALGISLEFLQSLTDYRSYDPLDMVANTTGVILGWLLALPGGDVFRRIESCLLKQRVH